MIDRAPASLDSFDSDPEPELTVVVREEDLANESSVDDRQIREMLRDARASGKTDVALMCQTALVGTGTLRVAARLGCAELWDARIAGGAAPGDREEAASLGASALESPSGELEDPAADASSTLGEIPSSKGYAASSRYAFSFVDFPCPLCHLPVVPEEVAGALRVPQHRVCAPVFPFGFGGPMFRVECPASLMQITSICDGSHGEPPCDDPGCWRLEEREASLLDGVRDLGSWSADEVTSQGSAYVEPIDRHRGAGLVDPREVSP